MPHLVAGMNFPKNFANQPVNDETLSLSSHLSLTGSSSSSLSSLSLYASLHLSSTPDSKLTFSINPSHYSFPHLFGRISQIAASILPKVEQTIWLNPPQALAPFLPFPSPPFSSPTNDLVHFGLELWHLVATILIISMRINWPNFVHLMCTKHSNKQTSVCQF